MSQGIYVIVENKHGERLEHTNITHYAGSCCTTGGNGICWCYTGYGSFDVSVSHYGYVSRSQRVHVSLNKWTDVYFTLSYGYELHASIEGVVHDEDDNPMSNMMVWGQGILGNTKYWGCLTQSDGTYSLPINLAGNYMICCGKNNYDTMTAVANYLQESSVPLSTTTINFTGDYRLTRSGTLVDPKIAISGRAIMIRDDLNNGYAYTNTTAQTNTVFAKTRKWTGSYLSTVEHNGADDIPDGYGGSQYD